MQECIHHTVTILSTNCGNNVYHSVNFHNRLSYSTYCDHIRITFMITVLRRLAIWWTILSLYADNIVTIRDNIVAIFYFHNMGSMYNILWWRVWSLVVYAVFSIATFETCNVWLNVSLVSTLTHISCLIRDEVYSKWPGKMFFV